MHDKNYVHRDIKASNFLFVERQVNMERTVRPTLGDFGASLKADARMKRIDMLDVFKTSVALMYGQEFVSLSRRHKDDLESKVRMRNRISSRISFSIENGSFP